jgi:predicted Fe-S protein YdhL (DUF1289 family)
MKTPCISICKINKDGLCIGCKRTLKEISNWIKYTEYEREKILRELKNR